MQIVIDVPEQIYLNAKTDMLCGTDVIVNAIKDGTALPKGHGRLIDVSEYFKKEFGDAREFLDNATIIIEADKAESEDKE